MRLLVNVLNLPSRDVVQLYLFSSVPSMSLLVLGKKDYALILNISDHFSFLGSKSKHVKSVIKPSNNNLDIFTLLRRLMLRDALDKSQSEQHPVSAFFVYLEFVYPCATGDG